MSDENKTRGKVVFEVIQVVGKVQTINSQSIRVYGRDETNKISRASGTAAATTQNGQSVYSKGAFYYKTDAATGISAVYQNTGTAASSVFTLIEGVEAVITGVIADAGLTGGGTEGTVTIAVGAGRGVAVRADAVDVGVNIYNNLGVPLTAGTLVYLSGYNTTNGITVTKADADAGLFATHVVVEQIADATVGVVYPVARVTALNTGGKTIGDPVYVDAATAGTFTFTAPTGADQIVQIVGIVKVVDAAIGEIEFFPGVLRFTKFPTSLIQNGAITNPKVADTTGLAGLALSKTALVVYDFAVDGGVAGTIALTGAPTIPDNAVVTVESYDVLQTLTSASDASTVALQLPTDGVLTTAIAISNGANAWDQGVFVGALGGLASPLPKKCTAARVPSLLVAGGENLTAGKIVFNLRYWISQ